LLRRVLNRRLQIERPGLFNRIFYRAHPEIKVSNLVYNDPYDLSKPMHVTFSIAINNYLPRGKKEAYLSPISSRLPFQWLFFFSRVSTDLKERKRPFRARCSQWVEIHETLKLPRGFKLLNPEKLKKVEGSGAEFSGNIQQKGDSILIKKSIKLKKRIYQPEDWKSFRESVLEFKKPEKNVLIVTRGGRK
jgi:hypothetical protein